MPMPIAMAHALAKRLADVRKAGVIPYLRPDGKSQVTIEYEDGRPVQVDTVVISAQHAPNVDRETLLKPDVMEHVIEPVLKEMDLDADGVRILVNPTGRFEIGGPKADTGLTGRKIMVDSYGGMAPHGGGCFSGKDATKVDRSAAYMARYAAKNVVAAGLAERVQLQVAYAIGKAHPVSFVVETFGTEEVDPARLGAALTEVFDFRPAAIIEALDLRRPIYAETACYGHFGRKGFPWEETDRAEDLRRALASAGRRPGRRRCRRPPPRARSPLHLSPARGARARNRPPGVGLVPRANGARVGPRAGGRAPGACSSDQSGAVEGTDPGRPPARAGPVDGRAICGPAVAGHRRDAAAPRGLRGDRAGGRAPRGPGRSPSVRSPMTRPTCASRRCGPACAGGAGPWWSCPRRNHFRPRRGRWPMRPVTPRCCTSGGSRGSGTEPGWTCWRAASTSWSARGRRCLLRSRTSA